MSATATSAPLPPGDRLHAAFLAIVPRIAEHGRIYFRHVKCPSRKEDVVQEVLALCWKWFVRLAQQGKDATQFASVLASYAAKAVRSGRRVCGTEKVRDVLAPLAQQRHGFVVEKLPDFSTLSSNPLEEALHDNTVSPVPDQVAFRADFPAWRGTRSERDRRIIDDLMVRERTQAVARKYGVSSARVSQLRRDFHDDWHRFCADPGDGSRPGFTTCGAISRSAASAPRPLALRP